MQAIEGKKVTVVGLGRFGGGIAVSRWLVEQGALVTVADQDSADRLADSVVQLNGLPIEFHFGPIQPADFSQTDIVVASPAIPPRHEGLFLARSSNIPVTTEIRLFIERCRATIIGVTGTKGKSTTTAMLGRMLAMRFTTHIGGNIGGSLLSKLNTIAPGDYVVLELSSYMLEHLKADRWSPHIGIVTMVGLDHLDWHGSQEHYIDAKKNLLRFQSGDDVAVLNFTDVGAKALASEARGKVIGYPMPGSAPFSLRLPGAHNQINAQGAFAASSILGVSHDEAQQALSDFNGLPHRLQLIHDADGVRWYNDSIATIPDAAIKALESFGEQTVIHIVGGKDKGLDAGALADALALHAKAVLCIGSTGERIADLVEARRNDAGPKVHRCGDLQTAVSTARRIAKAGDVVLLSPGYPSYDQFVNFEQRGDAFARLVFRH